MRQLKANAGTKIQNNGNRIKSCPRVIGLRFVKCLNPLEKKRGNVPLRLLRIAQMKTADQPMPRNIAVQIMICCTVAMFDVAGYLISDVWFAYRMKHHSAVP
jgi:hypothetical protein